MSAAEARAYADDIGALFIETSAKLNKSVQDVFVDISRRLPQAVETNFGEVADLRDDGSGRSGGGKAKKEGGCC